MEPTIKILVGEGCKGSRFMRGGVIERLIKPTDTLLLVGEAESQEQVVELYDRLKPELLLLAGNGPCAELPERIAELSQSCPGLNILILTPCQDGATVRATMRAGAKGVVLSSESTAMILEAIYAVAQGNPWFSPTLGAKLLVPKQPSLGKRALEVLRLLVEGKTDHEISITLKITDRTIRHHLGNIYDALHVQSRTRIEAVATARRLKLV